MLRFVAVPYRLYKTYISIQGRKLGKIVTKNALIFHPCAKKRFIFQLKMVMVKYGHNQSNNECLLITEHYIPSAWSRRE
jgi:hypothetical protein